jgi:CarD family transcriptional regulator
MFEVGDYIIYDNTGVCQVESIGHLDMSGASGKRLYYTLKPQHGKSGTIYTPVDNEKVTMRPVMTKDEAIVLIDEIHNIGTLDLSDEKKREVEYKEAFAKYDCRELVKVIKTIFSLKEDRIAEGKKVTALDEKYYDLAEEKLYGELAISLEKDFDSVKEYVIEHVKQYDM